MGVQKTEFIKRGLYKMVTLKLGGQAGQGVKSSGRSFAKFAVRSGYNAFTYTEYPSIIKGGHNVMQIIISQSEVNSPSLKTSILVALNQETIEAHLSELYDGSLIVFDGEAKLDVSKVPSFVKLCPLPLKMFSAQAGGSPLLINTVALGGAVGLMSGDIKVFCDLIAEEYGDKGAEVIAADQKAAELGYKFARDQYPNCVNDMLVPLSKAENAQPKLLLSGTEAAATGAIAAGLQFVAIYPMSPITNILHVLAQFQEHYGYVYKQPEDEIAAVNMAIGASFAGARALTATSGGGFALMAEGYGLAGITETPVVIIEGMRGGPATGLPTWTGQGDLRFVLHAHQDDFPRIVLTPGDAEETFHMVMKAFNLADKYQTAVVVLIDKNICENDITVNMLDASGYVIDRGKFTTEKVENYQRYKLEADGVSLRSVPGSGNFFIGNSDEHDEEGFSNEESKVRIGQMTKRMRKLEVCAQQDMPQPTLYGPQNADITFVSWGSTKGAILDGMTGFENVNFLHLTWANPFPTEYVKKVLTSAKHVVNVESNYTGQMASLIREKTGFEITDNFLKFDGRPFYKEEIVDKITSLLKGGHA